MRTYNSRQISTHTHAHTCTHINAAHVCSRVACPYRHLRIRYEYYTWPSIVPYIPWPTRSRLDSCAKRNERGALLAVEVREIGRGGAAVEWGREIQLHLVEVHGDIGSPCSHVHATARSCVHEAGGSVCVRSTA